NGELSPASPLQGGFDGLDIGAPEAGLIVTPARAEAPGVDQCARGGIVGAAAGLGDVEGISKHFEKSLRQYLPATGRRPVETAEIDRKSTRLNSSHVKISYAVFCLKKK